MSIIGVLVAFIFVASSAGVIVWAVRGGAPAAVTLSRPVIYRTQSALSEPNPRTADREQLRRYFLQGRPDGRGRVLPYA
jgi:hypothetical protein